MPELHDGTYYAGHAHRRAVLWGIQDNVEIFKVLQPQIRLLDHRSPKKYFFPLSKYSAHFSAPIDIFFATRPYLDLNELPEHRVKVSNVNGKW